MRRDRYRWHTGFPGGLKMRTARDLADRKPEEILRYNPSVLWRGWVGLLFGSPCGSVSENA